MALKGVAITVQYTAWDTAANAGKTGDVANHTLKIIKDGTAATPTNSPAEVDATNCPGVYRLALTAAEMGYATVSLAGKSSTSGVVIIPVHITTEGGYLDAQVSTRAPESGGNVAAIKAKTDNLPASPAAVGSAMTLTSAYDAAKNAAPETGGNLAAVKAKTDNLPSDPASNTQVNTRLATSGYTTPDNAGIAAIKVKTDNLPAAPAIEGNVQGHVAAALAAYDPPTKAEMVAAVAPLALEAGIEAHVLAVLNAYDPPSRAEATADKAAILAAITALNDITVGELLAGDLSDSLSFPANSLADRLRKLFWILCNRLAIVDATGAFTAYKGDGVTPGATGTIVDNGTNTVRSAPTWP